MYKEFPYNRKAPIKPSEYHTLHSIDKSATDDW